jgi:hypothetical protein
MNGQQQRAHTTKTQNLESMLTVVTQVASERFAETEKDITRIDKHLGVLDSRVDDHLASIGNLTRELSDLKSVTGTEDDRLLSNFFHLESRMTGFENMGFWARLKWLVRGAK